MIKRYIILFAVIVALIVAAIFGFNIWKNNYFKQKTDQEITILLESVKEVTKLVSIEAEFSEIFKHEEYFGLDWSPFKKKALIRVQSKVLVGTDFTNTRFFFDPDNKIIQISELPQSEIIAIDNQIDYYDIQQGSFNPFTAKDYNDINRKAREAIRNKVLESDILKRSDQRRDQVIQSFGNIATEMGWNLELAQDSQSSFLD